MKQRTFGRTGWSVSEIGVGTFGMGEWSGSNDDESMAALEVAIEKGCTFFDTAAGYGNGHSEHLVGEAVRAHPERRLYVATKISPKNRKWPSQRSDMIEHIFPPEHIREYVEKSLINLGMSKVDLIQFHVWEDSWAEDDGWQRTIANLKSEGLVAAVGISLNRWEPWNGIKTVETGLIDSVQVIYNIFDQSPEDELFPTCRENHVAVIARVPFDEGTLTGTLSVSTSFPAGDWRSEYFVPENLSASVAHAEALRAVLPDGMTMPEAALRFILSNPDVSTVIPGMRKAGRVVENMAASDAGPLPPAVLQEFRKHRWDRRPTWWSAG